VAPAFCAVLGAEVEPATTIVLNAPESVTAVHWEASPTPSKILVRTLAPEITDEERAKVREEMLNAIGGSKTIIDLESPLLPDSTDSDREIAFRAGEFSAILPASVAVSLDVRDKGELADLRAARQRDVMLWRVALGCAAALVLFALGEFALIGGAGWQRVRKDKIRLQKPAVDSIMASQAMANRIDELATKRMLPFEMITAVSANRKPDEITYKRTTVSPATGINTITIAAESTSIAQVGPYVATLRNLPMVAHVDLRDERTRGDTETFTLVVAFKPDTLIAADSISP
jgi:hypothetical protein